MNNNRNCITCGTSYEYCYSCRNQIKNPAWMTLYHNKNCKNLFDITSDYLAGDLSKDEAAAKYNECDLTNLESLEDSIKKAIKEVTVKEKVVENDLQKTTQKKTFKGQYK